jgi:hypothetical protein
MMCSSAATHLHKTPCQHGEPKLATRIPGKIEYARCASAVHTDEKYNFDPLPQEELSMSAVQDYRDWKLEIEAVPAAGMYTAKATITRSSGDSDDGYFSYTFKNLGVSDTSDGAMQWAADWLRGWIDDNE